MLGPRPPLLNTPWHATPGQLVAPGLARLGPRLYAPSRRLVVPGPPPLAWGVEKPVRIEWIRRSRIAGFVAPIPKNFPPSQGGERKRGFRRVCAMNTGRTQKSRRGDLSRAQNSPGQRQCATALKTRVGRARAGFSTRSWAGTPPFDRLNRPAIGSGFAFSRLALSSAWWWSPMCAVEAIRAARSLRHGGGRGPDSCRSWNSFRVDPCFPWLEVPLKHFRFLIGPLLMSLMREITGLSRGRDRKGLTRKGRRASGSRLRDHDRPGFRRRIGEGSRPYELAGSLGIAFWRRGSSEKQLHDAIRWHDVYKPPSQPDSSHRA